MSRDALIQSWYCLGKRKSGIQRYQLGNKSIVVYQQKNGRYVALSGLCAHLGADLSKGTIVGDQIQCAFHHWQFGTDGICTVAPGLDPLPKRKLSSYTIEERWGFLWIFGGDEPLFELPTTPVGYRAIRFPEQRLDVHPHLLIANGLDAYHFEPLHGMRFTAEPELKRLDSYRLSLRLQGRPTARWVQKILGRGDVVAEFQTIGGHLAWVEVKEPISFYLLFSGRPFGEKMDQCVTQTIFFLPKGAYKEWGQAVVLLYNLLYEDVRILNGIQFQPAFTEKDEPLRQFSQLIDQMDRW